MSLKPICVACRRFYRPEKNGYTFIEGKPIVPLAPPGLGAPGLWAPYKLWRGDLWKCEGCGHEIVSGVAPNPMSQDYVPGFEDHIKMFGDIITINDC